MDYPFTDKWIVCASCGKQFLWDAGEQAWYHLTKLKNQPRHCKRCRDERRKRARHMMFGAPSAAIRREARTII